MNTYNSAFYAVAALLVVLMLYYYQSLNHAIIESSQQKMNRNEYSEASDESYGFFNDIRNSDWAMLKNRVHERQNHVEMNDPKKWMRDDGPAWYMFSFNPDFTCLHERRVGGMSDGSKWVCDPHRIMAVSNERRKKGENGCLIYSIGSNGNFDFEQAMLEATNKHGRVNDEPCEVHIFDPKNYGEVTPNGMHFHHWGIKGSSNQNIGPNFKSLQETVNSLGHHGKVIDIFKIDCEGCEWESYNDWFGSGVTMSQILVEVHGNPDLQAIDFFETMQHNNYVTFHKEPNLIGDGRCMEYAFLKLDSKFFEGNFLYE